MTIPRQELVRLFLQTSSEPIESILSDSTSNHLPIGLRGSPSGRSIRRDQDDPASCTNGMASLLSKDELMAKYRSRLELLGYTSSQVEKMTREDICTRLFSTFRPVFNMKKCESSPLTQLKSLSLETGIPIPKMFSTKETKKEACQLFKTSLEHSYSNEPTLLFQEDQELQHIISRLGINPLPHQIRVAKFLLDHRGLLAVHRTGTGKTLTAILSILLLRQKYPQLRIVIMTPATLKDNFISQMIKFGTSIQEARVEVYGFDEYQSFYRQSQSIPSFKHTFLIVDEAHHMRSDIRINQQQQLTQSQTIFSIMAAASQAFRVLLLTATPFVNSLYDMNNLIAMVKGIPPLPGSLANKEEPYLLSRSEFQKLVQKGELVDFMRCHVSFYAPERSDDFPEQINMPLVYFVMGPEYYDRYHKIETGEGDSEIAKALGATSEGLQNFFSGLRRAVNALDGEFSPKIDWVIDFITREAAEGRKSVVYSNWKFAGMNLIRKRLDQMVSLDPGSLSRAGYVYITGDLPLDIRTQFKDLYNTDQAKILLISRAGSEGLDLTNTRNVIILESNWNPSSDLQIIGRAVRYKSHISLPPSERTVKVWRLLMKKPESSKEDKMKSIDEELYRLSYDIKAELGNQLIQWIQEASIENNECPSESVRVIETVPEKIMTVEAERPSIYRDEEYEYIAPDATALVTPSEWTTRQVAKIAGIPKVILNEEEWQ